MQLVNQHEIYETWAPIIESKTGLTERGKVEWLVMDGIPVELNEHVRDFLRKSLGSVWNNGFRYGMLNNI